MKILVIEDHKKVSTAIKNGLEAEGYSVSVAGTGNEGFALLNSEKFDLVVLDVMLPGRDGLDILSNARKQGLQTLFLMLTARDTVEEKVLGLETGADDYLVKPFAFPELLARIKALLRRGKTDQQIHLKIADLEMDLVNRTVARSKIAILLTVREFQLLEYLLKNKKTVVSREMLAQDVWHETNRVTPLDNVIDVHIARLRRKLDDPFRIKLLHTVHGVGFVLTEKSDR